MDSNPNGQVEMEKVIEALEGRKPSLLLHSCCGPCSTAVLERLMPYFDLSVYFYNPNIHPVAEYQRRKEELIRYLEKVGIPHLEEEYLPRDFFDRVTGMEEEPEGGKRCDACFGLRLEKTAIRGVDMGAAFFATTLTVSSRKDSRRINAIGNEIAEKVGQIAYLPSDFKKKGGGLRSLELSKAEGMYRQGYCGCIYSKTESEKRHEKQVR